ncbi:MAG: acyl-ACP--UDP-N-acetylglucosamine O-acyltransferase [Porphyromonas sp.]|nr:acyl-ACP--UDP-N-acetylglucosamine O-acyltransferase [Porphyromonas sp.]
MVETKISHLAVVHPNAKIGEGVEIGPFAVVDDNVEIGDGTKLFSGAVLRYGSRIGKECVIHPYAVVGGEPQDLKFKGEETVAIIGDRTTIREYATVSRGTASKGFTTVGSDVLLMAYAHVAHDCEISDKVIIGNACQIAGEVEIDYNAILGGGTLVHQFVRVGSHVMIQGGSRLSKDIPPYTLIGREPAIYCGINIVGLRRRSFTKEQIYLINDIYRTLYNRGLNNTEALQVIEEEYEDMPEKRIILDFIRQSQRGIIRGGSVD